MKRIFVLLVVPALLLGMLAGCGASGRYDNRYDDGTNVSTTDDGTVNGVNPNGEGMVDNNDAAPDGRVVTGTGVTEPAGTRTGSR